MRGADARGRPASRNSVPPPGLRRLNLVVVTIDMPTPGAGQTAADYPERRAGEVVDRAIAWLDSQSGRPFFLWVHVFDPHLPCDPPSPFREKYRGRLYDGEVTKQQARTIDLLPTLLDLMGGQAPPAVQGVSLGPALKGKELASAESYLETLFPNPA